MVTCIHFYIYISYQCKIYVILYFLCRKIRLADRQEIFRYLLQAMSNHELQKVDNGCTFLSHACMNGQLLLVSEILSHPPAVDIVYLGLIPLAWLAANEGNPEMLQLLLERSPRPREEVLTKAPDGTTPLTIAVLRNHEKILSIIKPYCDEKYFAHVKKELCIIDKQGTNTFYEVKTSNLVEISVKYPSFNDEIDRVMDKALEKGRLRVKEVQDYQEEQHRNPTKDPDRQRPDLSRAHAYPNDALKAVYVPGSRKAG